jgi:hypothetical protein
MNSEPMEGNRKAGIGWTVTDEKYCLWPSPIPCHVVSESSRGPWGKNEAPDIPRGEQTICGLELMNLLKASHASFKTRVGLSI